MALCAVQPCLPCCSMPVLPQQCWHGRSGVPQRCPQSQHSHGESIVGLLVQWSLCGAPADARVCARCVTPRSASSVNAQDWEWESDTFGSDSSCPMDATAAVFTALTVVLYIIGCWGWILQVCAQCILLNQSVTQQSTCCPGTRSEQARLVYWHTIPPDG